MGVIRFVGINDLDTNDQSTLKTLCVKSLEKLERDLPDDYTFVFTCKCYNVEGRPKYSFHGRIQVHTKLLVHANAVDWDMRRTTHKVMDKLTRELQHKYKTEGKHFAKAPR